MDLRIYAYIYNIYITISSLKSSKGDGVFDNLFLDEILEMANAMLLPNQHHPKALLHALAQRIVEKCLSKTRPLPNGQLQEAPIGRGGKKDDTSCVVAEVVEWTDELQKMWAPKQHWLSLKGVLNLQCCATEHDSDDDDEDSVQLNEASPDVVTWGELSAPAHNGPVVYRQAPQACQAPQPQMQPMSQMSQMSQGYVPQKMAVPVQGLTRCYANFPNAHTGAWTYR